MKHWKNKTLTMCVMNAILFGGSTLLPTPVVQAAEATTTVTAGNDASDPYTAITVTSNDGGAYFYGVNNSSGTMNLYLGGTNPTLTVTGTAPSAWIRGIINQGTLTVHNSSPAAFVLNATATSGAGGGTGMANRIATAVGIENNGTAAVVDTPMTVTAAAYGGTTEAADTNYKASAEAYGAWNRDGSLTLGRAGTTSSFTVTAKGGTAGIANSSKAAAAFANAYGLSSVTAVNGDLTLNVSAAGGTTLGTSVENDVSAQAYGIRTELNDTTVNGSVTLTQVAAKSGTNGQVADAAAYGTYSNGESLTITGNLTTDAVTADAGTNSAANANAYGICTKIKSGEEPTAGTTTIDGSVNLTSVKATASSTNSSAQANAYGTQNLGKLTVKGDFTANVTAAAAAGSAAEVNAYGLDNESGTTEVDGKVTLNVTADGGSAAANAASNASAKAYGVRNAFGQTMTLGKTGETSCITVTAKGGTAGTAGDTNTETASAEACGLLEVTTVNGDLDIAVSAAGGTTLGTSNENEVEAWAYGIWNSDNTATINGSVTITAQAAASAANNVFACGINAYQDLTITGDLTANAAAAGAGKNASSNMIAAGIANYGGTTRVGGNVTLAAAANNTGLGFKAAAAIVTGVASDSAQLSAATYINTTDGTTSLGKTVKLTGDVLAGNSGTNYIVLDGSSSWLKGNICNVEMASGESSNGTNQIIVQNGAVWQPVFDDRNGTFRYDSKKYTTTQNYAAALTLQDSGVIDLTWDNATRAADWRTLTIDSLSGDGGILCINADLANGNADQLSLGSASSTTNLNIDVKYDPYFTTAGLTTGSTLTGKALVVSGDGAANVTTVTGVKDTYNLYDYVPGFTKDTDNQWYLTSYEITNVTTSAQSDQSNQSDNLTASGAVRTAEQDSIGVNSFWFKEANSLSRRMGELRSAAPAEAGAWARWNKGEVEQGASQVDYNLGQVGYDRVLTGSHERTYRGGAISYAAGTGSYELGGGDLKESTLSLYQTGICRNGSYYDIILKAGKYIDDVNLTQTANPSHGDYSSWAYSVSGEYGRRYELGGGSYVEPQAELLLGRLQGADYTTSTGLQVSLGAQNKALTRLGAALGRDFAGGNVYFKASWYHDFGSGINLTGRDGTLSHSYSQDIARDWAELVLGGTVRAGQNCMVYGELSKYLGDLKSNLQFNLGARWSF